jgi:XRE family transcriptional regulator, regulator of sulfur utilization
MTFAQTLRQLREGKGFSQEGLARAANISTATVVRLERKEMDPSWSTVQALARALGVDCRSFQTEDASQAEPTPAKKKGRKR